MQEINTPTKVDPSVLTTFLETSIKLFCNGKSLKDLQELINKFSSKEKSPDRHHVVKKIGKHKARTGQEMRLTV